MRRTSLVLAAVGGAAVLAVTGAAIGVTTADGSDPATAPAAVTADVTDPVGGTADDNPKTVDDNPGRADDNPGADDSATAGTAPTRGAPDPSPRGAVDRQQAGRVALDLVGGGRIVEIEAETEHARPVWSVKVVRGGTTHEIKVDRADGTVVEIERRTADGSRTRDRDDDHGGDRSDDHGGDRSDGDD
ncbi:PepSY domain-containing protein [Micromonospora halotolerans]|uniref:PepSY domain-containing protein n=1 Tax=Micromonospora halotolerans TaxID=709879 RepID=A0ABZ0A0S2_9ACTN|nr:PepSY domain-containing protein [Micromonospora halotolerans]WNM40825.1 PepSY domain-containing protein [Micromonospora halotolerans]